MQKILSFFRDVLRSWYDPESSWLHDWLERLMLPALYLIGLYQWGSIIQWGQLPLDMADWSDITTPRLLVLQDAIQRNVFPFHILAQTGMKGITDRFLAIPDIILSPQILLLKILDPGRFILLDLLLLYTIGFIGLYIIKRKYRLSLAVFNILFLLFMFNGHIEDHIFIGHATWMSYFLLPFFILLMLELFEKPQGWRWINQMVWLQVIVLLQGGFHFIVFMLLFIFLAGILNPRILKTCLTTCIFGVLACFFRLLPASLISTDLNLGYLGGFTTLNELLSGLVSLMEPTKVADRISQLNPYLAWWEFDYYVGWLGLLFITATLFWGWRKKIDILRLYSPILAPSIILTILSIGRLYRFVFMLGIPGLNAERVGSRLFLLPLVFAITIAAITAQRLLDRYKIKLSIQLVLLGGLLILFGDLAQHAELWGVSRLKDMMLPEPIDSSLWVVANHPDPTYTTILLIGGAVSIFSLVLLATIRLYGKRSKAWLISENNMEQS